MIADLDASGMPDALRDVGEAPPNRWSVSALIVDVTRLRFAVRCHREEADAPRQKLFRSSSVRRWGGIVSFSRHRLKLCMAVSRDHR